MQRCYNLVYTSPGGHLGGLDDPVTVQTALEEVEFLDLEGDQLPQRLTEAVAVDDAREQ